jgi:predicted GNAT family N-acyltransferase
MEIRKISVEQTWEIRQQVMWPNKDIEFIKLADDSNGTHYGLFEGNLLACVISVFCCDGVVQFRKFATLANLQGNGYGTRLLTFVMAEASQMGAKKIWCNARKEKANFYKKFGLREMGAGYEKDGVEYVTMGKDLAKKVSHAKSVTVE